MVLQPQRPGIDLRSAAKRSGVAAGLSPQQQATLLGEISRRSGQFIESLGLVLDTPGAIARGVLAGDPYSGFSFDNQTRVSGAELLEKAGIDPENRYIKAAAGFGTEVVTDPLFWFSGGLSSLTQAGDAARAAGLLKQAPLAYMQKYGTDAAEQTLRGQYVTRMFDKGAIPKTLGNYKAVAPVGQRLAQNKVTLEEVVNIKAAGLPAARANQVRDEAISKIINRVGSREVYDQIKTQPLGGLIGLNVGKLVNAAVSPPGTETILDALDYLGAAARFSYPGRLATAAFSKASGGAVDAGEQIASLRASMLEDTFRQKGQLEATKHSLLLDKITLSDRSKQMLGADTLFSPEGNAMLTRLAESKPQGNDLQILADTPAIKDWLSSWEIIRNKQFSERKLFGLKGPAMYKDRFGTEYTPRYGDEFDFGDQARGAGRLRYTAAETEAMGRRKYLMTPGGTDDLRELSLLPEVIAHSKPGAQSTDEQVGQRIMDWFKAKYPLETIGDSIQRQNPATGVMEDVPNPQVVKIARVMARLKQDLPPGTTAFAAHPANAQVRRIISHEVAMSRANFIVESLAEAAVQAGATQQVGRWRNLAQSFDEVGRKTGFQSKNGNAVRNATEALKVRIASATGQPVSAIDLSKYSVPEQTVRRLEKIADFYSVPQAQGEILKFLDGWTTLWKSFLLATPRRFVRDAYSNAISGWLETGSAKDSLIGLNAAAKIVNGNYDGAMPTLRTIPRYAGLGSDEAIREQFILDAGSTGVLSGLQTSELLSTVRSGSIGQLVPGATPLSISKGIQEFVPDGSRSLPQIASDVASPFVDFFRGRVGQQYEQRNPLLRASNTINDTIDSSGRLGTFIALLKQGISPEEAAVRVKSALVDYQSLTLLERKWLRSVLPWYSYNSRIGAYAVQNLFMRPGGSVGQMVRATNTLQQADEDTYIPSNLRKQFAIRLPDEFTQAIGMYQPGNETYLADVDFPAIDVGNMGDVNSVQGTLRNIFAQSSPPLQALVSLAMNRDLFYDRPLNETVTPQDRIYNALTGSSEGLSPLAKVAVGMVPGIQVPINIGGALADPRIEDPWQRALKAAVNFASGVKFKTIDEKYLREDRMRKLDEALAETNKTRTMQRVSIPAELVPTLTPKQQDLVKLKKIEEKKDREADKREKKKRDREKAKQSRSTP